MYVSQRFHRSIYVTLGMACACLGYSELTFLPEMSILAAVVALLLVVAYKLEGRWSLSLGAANVLGGVIGVGAMAWVAYQFLRPWGGTLLDQLPWPTSLLPYLGPLLMILIPAKLFRPKHNGDFWGLHGVGLIAVALGCALAGDLVFGALLVGYLVCLVWSLTLFYYYRGQQDGGGAAAARRWATPPRTLAQSGRWAALVGAAATLLFLATPRSGDARWQLNVNGRMQTGYSDDRPTIDLNRTGTIGLNREVAFSVRAYDADGQPVTGLDPLTRWRGTTFNFYEDGRWDSRPSLDDRGMLFRPNVAPPQSNSPQATLPDLGPRQVVLHFYPSNRIANPNFLAEPVWHTFPPLRVEKHIPAVSVFESRAERRPVHLAWYASAECELSPPPQPAHHYRLAYYKQVVLPPAEPGLGPPVKYSEFYLEHMRNYAGVPRLRQWTAALLRRLADQKRLPAAALGPEPEANPRVEPEYYEAVARALEAYLATSGEFKYSLSVHRQSPRLDPVEDFLYYTHRGHCNRFATALTLMLRSQGVPARIVLGFRGLDEIGEGHYEVRQSHAHSWVEALVRPTVVDGRTLWHWRTFDPTPSLGDDEAAESQWTNWWEDTRIGMMSFFKDFIVEYDADTQDRTRAGLWESAWAGVRRAWRWVATVAADWTRWAAALAVCAAGAAGWRAWRRRGAADPDSPPDVAAPFLDRLLGLLARLTGAAPRSSQTPRELAEDASGRLRRAPATEPHAGLPLDAVVLYYRVRFGRHSAGADDRRDLLDRLDRLDELTRGPVVAVPAPSPAR
jgi:transglutaminase-like putative cysteine protease